MKLTQSLRGAAATLFDYSLTVPVIDTHEHIPRTEQDYNQSPIKFGNLFNPYVSNDLASAGMPFPRDQWAAFVCIQADWAAFEPYWKAVKHGSYARPLRIALREFYGVNDFSQENFLEIVRQINRNNQPGIYRKIFTEMCGIEKAVRCAGDLSEPDDPILVGNISSPSLQVTSKAGIDGMAEAVGAGQISSMDELLDVSDRWMEIQVKQGAIEFKAMANPVENPDRADAETSMKAILDGNKLGETELHPLTAFIREANARKAAELGVPLAVHTGVWGDFRILDVNHLIGFIQRNPDTRIDMYHLGIPQVRSAIQIVKNFPNAYLNLCWAHIVAPEMVVSALKEAIDMVPLNKIFAFGADYVLFIEKVYGHLLMARENIAIALGDRVDRNLLDLSDAQEILHAWFYQNPKDFYRL
ncbi:amidohydrolase family protein [candidate division KSB1 bacterium]|nr:amidohydrolase family protein [candidate division KSB1 bacterium]